MIALAPHHPFLGSDPFTPQRLRRAQVGVRRMLASRLQYRVRCALQVPWLTQIEEPKESASRRANQTSEAAAAMRKILVVEDEGIVALDLIATLRQMGYVVCAHAMSGREALQLVADTQPDVILMDIRLKEDMDGIEAARQIRARHGSIPVIFLTAFSDENTLRRARTTGCAGYLAKPFSKHVLQDTIARALVSPSDKSSGQDSA